jgi:hypothetical protein
MRDCNEAELDENKRVMGIGLKHIRRQLIGVAVILLPLQCFASGHLGYSNIGNEILMMVFYLIILIFSAIAFPHIRSNRKNAKGVLITQFLLISLFSLLLYKTTDEGFFLYSRSSSWLGFLLLILLINLILFIRNNKTNQ